MHFHCSCLYSLFQEKGDRGGPGESILWFKRTHSKFYLGGAGKGRNIFVPAEEQDVKMWWSIIHVPWPPLPLSIHPVRLDQLCMSPPPLPSIFISRPRERLGLFRGQALLTPYSQIFHRYSTVNSKVSSGEHMSSVPARWLTHRETCQAPVCL